jgi:hypothetical protein
VKNIQSLGLENICSAWMPLMLQIHHYSLLIFLHLPYMLRHSSETKWDYSKHQAMCASREVLVRYGLFRSANETALSCRHVDYSALVAAMTLLIGYLGRKPLDYSQQKSDMELVTNTCKKMRKLSELNDDKLLAESADIVKRMLPIIYHGQEPSAEFCNSLHVKVPYLGTVSINPAVIEELNLRPMPALVSDTHTSPSCSTSHSQAATPSTDLVSNAAEMAGIFSSAKPTNPPMSLTLDPGFVGLDSNLQIDFDTDLDSGDAGQHMHLDGAGYFGDSTATSDMPGLTADVSDWLFQGVDTTYWSLLNGGFVQNGQ